MPCLFYTDNIKDMSIGDNPLMRILYFAWLREQIGKSEETVGLPEGITTVGAVIHWLKTRGPEFSTALAHDNMIRAALDQVHVNHDTPIGNAQELALFPPMTGG